MGILAWVILGLIAGLIADYVLKTGLAYLLPRSRSASWARWSAGSSATRSSGSVTSPGLNFTSIVIAALGAIAVIGIARLVMGDRSVQGLTLDGCALRPEGTAGRPDSGRIGDRQSERTADALEVPAAERVAHVVTASRSSRWSHMVLTGSTAPMSRTVTIPPMAPTMPPTTIPVRSQRIGSTAPPGALTGSAGRS